MKKIFLLILSLFLLIGTKAYSQKVIKGLVIASEDGLPIPGASVKSFPSLVGTTTGIDGKFSLKIAEKDTELRVAYLGYETKKVKINQTTEFKIVLTLDSKTLDQVVVNAGGISIQSQMNSTAWQKRTEKRSLGYATTTIVAGEVKPVESSYDILTAVPSVYAKDDVDEESYNGIKENGFIKADKDPLSTFSIDVDAASYSNIRRFINNGSLPPKDAVRIEEMINYFDYDYAQPTGDDPVNIITEIAPAPWNPNHRLLHIGLQAKTISNENLPASNIVFLIDVSGSMDAPNKLPLLISSLKLLTDQLRDKDKVAIVVYAGSSGLVLPSTDGNNKIAIKEALNKLQAGGSTAGGAGLQLAYKVATENFIKGGNNRIVLATDGDFNVGQSSDSEMQQLIEEKRKSGVFLTVLGYGMGNYKDSKMETLADKGNGNYAYIDNITEARKVLVKEFGGTLFTVAKDVKFQLEFNPDKVQAYRLIGYENRMLNSEDFNDDKKDAGEIGSGHTVTALYEVIPVGVKSEFASTVDALKYQQTLKTASTGSAELLTIKLRYKQPDGSVSKKIEKAIIDNKGSQMSENFRFSAAVAEFGMLLRQSAFKQKSSFDQVIELSESAMGKDKEGYRSEFLRLAKSTKLMAKDLLSIAEKNGTAKSIDDKR